MSASLLSRLAAVVSAAVFSVSLAAQASPLPNTGCPGSSPVTLSAQPRVGTTVNFEWSCPASDVPMIFFGNLLPLPIPLPSQIVCGNTLFCNIVVSPDVFIQGAIGALHSVPVPIPNDSWLVGVAIGVQGACFGQLPNLCVRPGQASSVRLMM